uniref:CBM21 domain-containing protein n=1 Tax=Heterorhabditis bacteriophora TaxID=37862 RepID=A0A1I7X5S1_HETBA
MSQIRQSEDLDSIKSELINILHEFLMGRKRFPLLIFPGSQQKSESKSFLTRYSNVSDYLNVERSKSLHSALKKCTRTPAEKKVVSFADSMGLDLCNVRPIFPYNSSDDDIFGSALPITLSVMRSTTASHFTSRLPFQHCNSFNNVRYLHLQTSPYSNYRDPTQVNKELIQKAKSCGICLKSSNVIGMTFSGVITVNNIDFDKKVYVRYTLDDWKTYLDIPAYFIGSNSQENLDNFSFSIFLPSTIPVGMQCQFCLRYLCRGTEFWDNNGGRNYVLECRSMAFGYKDLNKDMFEQPRFY